MRNKKKDFREHSGFDVMWCRAVGGGGAKIGQKKGDAVSRSRKPLTQFLSSDTIHEDKGEGEGIKKGDIGC